MSMRNGQGAPGFGITGDPAASVTFDGDLAEPVAQHVFAVNRRGLDPDGDGDPTDGLDGFRLVVSLDSLWAGLPANRLAASWAMAGSHDSPRLLATLANPQARYKQGENPREQAGYLAGKPGPDVERALRLFRVLQFTLHGAPILYYGDEAGLWGADDPDNRRPMLWPELTYEDEAGDPLGRSVRPSPAAPATSLIAFTTRLAHLRTTRADVLGHAPVEWLVRDAARGVLVYRRGDVTVAVNMSDDFQGVEASGTVALNVGRVVSVGNQMTLDPRGATVVVP